MKHTSFLILGMVLALVFVAFACTRTTPEKVKPAPTTVKNLDWVKNAVIYEVNVRQYTKEGTFNAFAKDLPRLKSLGIDILWLMPVNPIGKVNRKGPLGSYYSVQDYKAINPEYGNMDDFKNLVKLVHEQGMKVVIDWVPNHSSWDNPMIKEHPEYYLKDTTGKMVSPFDWTDVVRFDYNNPEMRKWMIETMKYWLTETNIDGFRCDVAHMVPVSFWDSCRTELDKTKPIFFLAEADQPFLHANAFDASYDWKFHHIMNQVAKGKKSVNDIEKHFNWVDTAYPQGSILMEFTSNHDENSWNGTEYERMGDGAKIFAALTFIVPGMPLIYSGQESGFNRRLKFFEKDSIDWKDYPLTSFYQKLISAKKGNEALWNGIAGGTLERIKVTNKKHVLAIQRTKGSNTVIGIFNFSSKTKAFAIESYISGEYTDVFSENTIELHQYKKMHLAPWAFMILVKK